MTGGRTGVLRARLIGAALLCVLPAAAPSTETAAADPLDHALQAWRDGDAGRAAAEFRALAEAGAPEAQYNLALLFRAGQGVPINVAEAAYWAWRARLAGLPEAAALVTALTPRLPDARREALAKRLQADLVPRIAAGDGRAMVAFARTLTEVAPEPDRETALVWLSMAAALGTPGAAEARDAALTALPEPARLDVQDRALARFLEWCGEADAAPASCRAAGAPALSERAAG